MKQKRMDMFKLLMLLQDIEAEDQDMFTIFFCSPKMKVAKQQIIIIIAVIWICYL